MGSGRIVVHAVDTVDRWTGRAKVSTLRRNEGGACGEFAVLDQTLSRIERGEHRGFTSIVRPRLAA